MATDPPLLTATTPSARQLRELLRCLPPARKSHIRISAQGLRITTEESSITEAFVFLDRALFTTYTYTAPPPASSQDDTPPSPHFQISLPALLETLNIFTLSDPAASSSSGGKAPDAFASHRLARHAGLNNPFTSHTAGLCTLSYEREGAPLQIHMSESGVTTTSSLTTFLPHSMTEIPFARHAIALKTILRSSALSEAVSELSSFNPESLTLSATASSHTSPTITLSASGALGSAAVAFTTSTPSDTPVLETYTCPSAVRASFKFSLIKAAQRAMSAAAKFLVEVEGLSGQDGGGGHTFVEFRVVPLVDGEVDEESGDEEDGSEGD
ncbi:checkpoint clamp complex protein Rad1 [Oleoguttula sp. CCFEE 5521]